MTNDEREINRKLRVLKYADKTGNINKTCLSFRELTLIDLIVKLANRECLLWVESSPFDLTFNFDDCSPF